MNKTKKCISQSLAKQISEIAKAKNIELPESEWWWKVEKIYGVEKSILITGLDKKDLEGRRTIFNAYDCSELGEMLIKANVKAELRGLWKYPSLNKIFDPNFLGKMYLYLMENDLLK